MTLAGVIDNIRVAASYTGDMQFNLEILIQFLLAALWGSIVGAEREYRGKAAGFRTTIMISVGACFFTIMSVHLGFGSSTDRIASNIVTGIGFLGAGVIFRGENQVNGITTAATIWAVAAVGMGIGGGFYFASSCASVLIVIILAVLPAIENYLFRVNQAKEYSVKCPYSEGARQKYEALFASHGLKYRLLKQIVENGEIILVWQAIGAYKRQESFTAALLAEQDIIRLEC
ncbi:MgtC/SapB family protein [Arcticibacter sp. MXS-1]|uniref:MgtC/SapB family protein n=1 Tax=Arcticibacter sp. MXS-1 TaxID=3341726 RepID=UPI0035A9155E